jgi:hypothetical protein
LNTKVTHIEVYLASNEPKSLVNKFSHSSKILDTEIKPVALENVAQIYDKVNSEEQHQVLKLLQQQEHLLDCTIGELKIVPIGLELIYPGVKPVSAPCPYSFPRGLKK